MFFVGLVYAKIISARELPGFAGGLTKVDSAGSMRCCGVAVLPGNPGWSRGAGMTRCAEWCFHPVASIPFAGPATAGPPALPVVGDSRPKMSRRLIPLFTKSGGQGQRLKVHG